MIKLTIRCPKHPRYKAVLPPRVKNCTGCKCPGVWAIAQWARRKESAEYDAVYVHLSLVLPEVEGV